MESSEKTYPGHEMSGWTRKGPPNVKSTYLTPAQNAEPNFWRKAEENSMKKTRLFLAALIATLAMSAAACTSPTGTDGDPNEDHVIGSGNHVIGSGN
jgi:hypothetical protein